jgi:hypothetical protein
MRTTPQAKMKGAIRSEIRLMAVRQPRYSKEEFTQWGDALYESQGRSASATKSFAGRSRESWQACVENP